MKIVFVGQTTLTERLQNLAMLAGVHHAVTVFTREANDVRQAWNVPRVRVRRLPFLLPGALGEWFYTLASLLLAATGTPDVVHIHGWKLAALSPLLGILLPDARLIWTVDEVPTHPLWLVKLIARSAAWIGDGVTTSRREVQWQLLTRTGIRAAYVPDGYSEQPVVAISPRRFGLWAGRFCLATAETPAELAWIAAAYAATGSRKKLVVLCSQVDGLHKVAIEYDFLTLIPTQSERVRDSLMTGASAVILGSSQDSPAMVLAAMRSGKPIVALTQPFHEEILGVTAHFVFAGDAEQLTAVLKGMGRGGKSTYPLARRAAKRAQAHFRWERIWMDYLHLYQPATFLIPLDSAYSVRITEPSVQ